MRVKVLNMTCRSQRRWNGVACDKSEHITNCHCNTNCELIWEQDWHLEDCGGDIDSEISGYFFWNIIELKL